MEKYLYFRSVTDEANDGVTGLKTNNPSSFLFPASTLTAMQPTADTTLTLYFGNAQQHIVVLACADDASDVVARALCVALAPLDKFHQKMVTVADDTLSTYLVSGITGVTSLTADPA